MPTDFTTYQSIPQAYVGNVSVQHTQPANRLPPNTMAVYYDEYLESFSYAAGSCTNIISTSRGEENLIQFYAQHSRNINIVPERGSRAYYAIVAEANQRGEDKAMTLAKPANEYSIVVSYNEEDNYYYTSTPNAYHAINTWRYDRLEKAYEAARNVKADCICQDYGKPWNIWPRKNSSAHRMLTERIDGNAISVKASFMEILNELNGSLSSASSEAEQQLNRIYKALCRRQSSNGGSPYGEVVINNLNRYIKSYTGVEYVFACYDDSANTRLVHPENSRRFYTGNFKEEGYRLYTKAYVKRIGKDCVKCSEAFKTSKLNLYINKYYCANCMDEMGLYRCSLCPSWHNEDEGCPSYHATPREHIYGYSTDVRKVIHKMYKVDADKKINGEYLRYGIELEVLPKNSVASKIAKYNCGSALYNYALLKSDSSLGREGFEIVTVPATLEFHRKTLWHDFFNKKAMEGLTAAQSVQSWNTSVCGIHVHVTRAALTEMQLSKLLVFYHEPYNSTFLSRIAGRKVGPDAEYCKAAKKKLRASVAKECGNHHGAITISHRNNGKTAEVRIFRGNSTYHGVMRSVEFVDATVKWCGQNSTDAVLDYKNFLDWFNQPTIKKQYPELRKHLIDLKYLKARLKEGAIPHPKMPLETVTPELKQA